MTDQTTYCNEMAKGIEDKLFFLDKIEVDNIIDFGCADGQVTRAIAGNTFTEVYGYDKNPQILPDNNHKQDQYFSDWPELLSVIPQGEGLFQNKTAILFSSLLHEVYSNGEQEDVKGKIFDLQPDYIIIRDMYVSDEDKEGYLSNDTVNAIVDNVSLRLVNHFIRKWGPIVNIGNMIHFLMKHRFAYNWEYEMQENYLALDDDRIDYWESVGDVVFEEHYPLPYYKDVFKSRYGFDLNVPTHIKLIIQI